MPLETATYLPDLVVSNPAHTDGLSQADSHMRLLKATLKNTFPNFTDVALASTQAQLDAAVNGTVLGTAAHTFALGTVALPGLTPYGNPNTGFYSPTTNQLAVSLNGAQVLLMGGTALVTTLGIAAAAFATTGAYSGGTGQLVPIGAVLEWYDDVLPVEGGYCWANGQIIASANTVAPVLLARWGSRFGGNGTTTMGVPDRRETVGVGKSTMGGASARGILTNFTAVVTNALIGSQSYTILKSDLPNFQPSFLGTAGIATSNNSGFIINGFGIGPGASGGGASPVGGTVTGTVTSYFTPVGTISSINGGVTQTLIPQVQPSTICNYILRLG